MPAAHPPEFRQRAVELARLRETPIAQIAKDLRISESCLRRWMDIADRVRSEPAWARLCGVAPIPASSGMTTRHRLNRGGHRQANSALYRSVIVRMQYHEPTRAYVARRTA